jgi:hypothetical protein
MSIDDPARNNPPLTTQMKLLRFRLIMMSLPARTTERRQCPFR